MAKIKNERLLKVDRLKEVLRYEPETGLFFWVKTLSPKAVSGSVAGAIRKRGYRIITIDKEQHRASRLAWLYTFGALPEKYIDHINRNKADDRISNLRLAEPFENSSNVAVTVRSKSGLKGVCRTPWGWQASIRHKGKLHHLGSFRSSETAAKAYEIAAKKLHGEFASA